MEYELINNILSTWGFPTACCIALFWKVNKQDEEMAKRDSLHKDEMESIKTALNNNTLVLTRLCEKLGGKNE